MKTVTPVLIRRVRFRRWNRHSYSTFCSIGRCINIGSVRKEIADQSLKKGLVSLDPCNRKDTVWTEHDESLPDDSSPELSELQPQAMEALALCSVSPLAADAPARSVSASMVYTLFRHNGPTTALCRIFYFCHPLKSYAYGQF